MILTDAQCIEFIKKPYAKEEIDELRKQTKELRAFITGKNAKDYLTDIPQFERDELRQERLKMMLSCVDVLSSTLSPRDRIFSAKGGVEYFIITNEQKEKDFRIYLDNITQGLSLRGWIQNFAIRRNDYDPNGIILVEQDKNKRIYPCFKSILDIHDRQLNGRTPEYLILKLTPKEITKLKNNGSIPKQVSTNTEIFRVIDDMQDRLFYKDRIITGSSCPSFSAPKFPAIVSSNIPSDEDGIFYSPINDCIERLRQYILHSSLYNVVFARQAFPKEFLQRIDCQNCQGTGFVDSLKCQECHGCGMMLSQKHSDAIIIDWSDEANKHIPNPPMGNVPAAVDTLEYFDDDIEKLKDIIYYIFWGMYKSDKISSIRAGVTRDTVGSNVEPTAYQAMLNAQPMVTKLVKCSQWYVEIYRFIINIVGTYKIGNDYKGCSILGGDRFMIESPDATWDRYLKAVTAQAPMSELDSILVEYIENKYANNPILYRKYMLLLGVEPFTHYKIEQVMSFDIPIIQKYEKIYFSSWKNSLTEWDFTSICDNLLEDEQDNDENDEAGEDSTLKNDPCANLRKALRAYVLLKVKDDGGLPIPTVNEQGQVLPMNTKPLGATPPLEK